MARGQQAGLLHNSVTAALTITDCARSRDAGSLDHYDYLQLCILVSYIALYRMYPPGVRARN
jgi:hypothetical protein